MLVISMRLFLNCFKYSLKQSIDARQFDRQFFLQMSSMSVGFFTKKSHFNKISRYYGNHAKADKAEGNNEKTKIKKISDQYLNYVYITTSKERWIEFETGIEFDVGLFDSFAKKEYDKQVPVILGIPSCVGSHEDLVEYLYTFIALGYRVIVPNLPGTKYCKAIPRQYEHAFTMSTNEKAEFIKDVLESIKITQVDMLVADSDSVHTALELTSGPMFKLQSIKSLVLINPIGLNYTQTMKPLWLYKRLSSIVESHRLLAPLLRLLINTCKIFSEKRKWPADDVLLFSRHIGALSFHEAELNIQRFKHRPVPMHVFYGDIGSSISIPSTEDMLNRMGVSKSIEVICDTSGTLITNGTSTDDVQCFLMPDRQFTEAHMTFIRTELIKFLKILRPDILEL